MSSLNITVSQKNPRTNTFQVEIDADRLERLAANFGFFNPDFLESLEKSENDYENGTIKKISSLKELRK